MTEFTTYPNDEGVAVRGDAVVIDLDWCFASDLDLGLLYHTRGGEVGLVCADEIGKRTMPPYVHLRHQSHGEGRRKTRREHGVVTQLSAHSALYLFVWDVKAAEAGSNAAFAQEPDSYSVTVRDPSNRHVRLKGMRSGNANCLLMGRIAGAMLTPLSSAATLCGASRSASELLPVIEEATRCH